MCDGSLNTGVRNRQEIRKELSRFLCRVVGICDPFGQEAFTLDNPPSSGMPNNRAQFWGLTSSAVPRGMKWKNKRLGAIVRHTRDRKSTRLNSSHQIISYAVFC